MTMSILFQAIADGILTGAILSLSAIGLSLTMGVLRFANFSHAELISWGAYVTWAPIALIGAVLGALNAPLDPFSFGPALILSAIIGAAGAILVALLIDRLVFRPLRGRANDLTLVFASFGVALLTRKLLIFGGQALYYTRELQIALRIGGIRVMPDQIFVLLITIAIVTALHLFLRRTRMGLAMRALAENPTLARINGVNTQHVIIATWVIGAGLAAIAGVLYGLTVQLRPEIGFNLLLPVFAAVIFGGVGSVGGAVLGGLFVGLAESLSVFIIPIGYKPAIPFLVLLIVLVLRPSGLFPTGGRK